MSSSSDVVAAAAVLHGEPGRAAVRELLRSAGITADDIRITQVLSRPGRREVVRWRVAGNRGERIDVVGVAASRLPDGLEPVRVAGHEVGLFVVPDDPSLPGLAAALDPAELGRRVGLSVVSCRQRRYRPLARAVVEARLADGRRVWVKVLRPERAAELAAVHERCGTRIRVPTVLAHDHQDGIVVLDHVPGRDLRSLLRDEGSALPPPSEIVEAALSLARVASPMTVGRTPPLASAPRSATRLQVVLPPAAARVRQLAVRIGRASQREVATPGPTVHGDLHAAQLQVGAGRLVGLVDLDDAGAGDPRDDLARFLAHAVCTTDRDAAAWARPWVAGYHAVVREHLDDGALRSRVAAALLSLALGPHRVQGPDWRADTMRRLDLATHWLDGRPGERPA